MKRQYQFALTQLAQGRTVLVYHGITARMHFHVSRADRLSLVDDVLHVDGKAMKGATVCLKPQRVV